VATAAIAPKTTLCLRTIFWKRYALLGGRATMGSLFKCRSISAATPLAVSYRRERSFSRHFIDDPIQVAAHQVEEFGRLSAVAAGGGG